MLSLDRHFEEAAPALPVACTRIGMGLTGMLFALFNHRDFTLLLQNDVLKFPVIEGFPLLPLAWLPIYTSLAFIASLAFSLGAYTSISGAVLAGCILYRHLADWSIYQNFTILLAIFVLLLIPGHAGARLSIDALRKRAAVSHVPLWPQTLIKFQLSAVYFYTALVKCNPIFLEGAIFRERIGFFTSIGPIATIALEFFLAFALWIPKLRKPAIVMGTAFHCVMLFALGFYAALIGFFVEFLSVYILFWTTPDTSKAPGTDGAAGDLPPAVPGTAAHPN